MRCWCRVAKLWSAAYSQRRCEPGARAAVPYVHVEPLCTRWHSQMVAMLDYQRHRACTHDIDSTHCSTCFVIPRKIRDTATTTTAVHTSVTQPEQTPKIHLSAPPCRCQRLHIDVHEGVGNVTTAVNGRSQDVEDVVSELKTCACMSSSRVKKWSFGRLIGT
jgi:hypothetical protein